MIMRYLHYNIVWLNDTTKVNKHKVQYTFFFLVQIYLSQNKIVPNCYWNKYRLEQMMLCNKRATIKNNNCSLYFVDKTIKLIRDGKTSASIF